jgi:hypothetical protein
MTTSHDTILTPSRLRAADRFWWLSYGAIALAGVLGALAAFWIVHHAIMLSETLGRPLPILTALIIRTHPLAAVLCILIPVFTAIALRSATTASAVRRVLGLSALAVLVVDGIVFCSAFIPLR